MTEETAFARTADGAFVAYQVSGSGPVDLVLLRGWVTNVEHEWDEPGLARVLKRLGAGHRLIRLDRRGMGLSDRIRSSTPPTLESRMDDIVAVMDAAGSQRAVLVGLATGGRLCALVAASHPERVRGLVLYHTTARGGWAEDYPWGVTVETREASIDATRAGWGLTDAAAAWIASGAPARARDRALIEWLALDQRLSGTADDAERLLRIEYETDIRGALGSVTAPTLVLARQSQLPPALDLVGRIPGATLVELPSDDYMALSGDTDAFVRAVVEFADGLGDRDTVDDRALATVFFADVVDSTGHAVRLGDRGWAELLEAVRGRLRSHVARYRGREVDTAGDGYFASFDGPGRAIRCAVAAAVATQELGVEIRVGLHTGECERRGPELRGVAVHIGARVMALAGPSEVLVSGTVKDLVAGSGFVFEERGVHALKGVPGAWPIFAVTGS